MKSLFKNPVLQEQMDRNGYIVVPLLNNSQIERLRRLYAEFIDQTAINDLYESSRHNSPRTNERINQAICEELLDAGKVIFKPCEIYGGTFMVKSCKDSTVLPVHQDWSVVEEDQYNTCFIWCALQEVDVLNGGLFVLEGSHKYFENLRSGTYPSDRYVLPHALHGSIKNVPLRAGEAVIYSDRLFHGSHSNNSCEDRLVVTGRIVEEGASLVYFHKKNEAEVDVYPADPEFYLTHIDSLAKGELPPGLSKRYTRAYRHNPITAESLVSKIKEHLPLPGSGNVNCNLFKDPSLQTRFDCNGYVVIDLIQRNHVEDLLAYYHGLDHPPMPEYGFQVSLDNEQSEFVRGISETLKQTVRSPVAEKFQDFQIFTASFVVKEANPLGVVPPHQDWTFVDEQKYWSATIWCPLVDVDIDNGALGVIQGSHHFYDHVRPSPSPQYEPPFKDQLTSIFPYLKIVQMKAGQALVFNNRTFHASPPNTTDQTRIAFGLGITHQNAGLQHFYLLPNQKTARVERYDVTSEFFFSYNNARLSAMHEKGERPRDLNSTGLFEYTHKTYDAPQLVKMIEAAGNVRNEPLIERMTALFGNTFDVPRRVQSVPVDQVERKHVAFWQIYTPMNIYREIKFRILERRLNPLARFSTSQVVKKV